MKNIKVSSEVHQEAKVLAASSGRTTYNLTTELLRWAFVQVAKGRVKLDKLPREEVTRP